MPILKMKAIWDYSTYNKPFFLLIFLLFVILKFVMENYDDANAPFIFSVAFLLNMLLCGYGMTIARDRMNNGVRLPKIMVKDVLIFGIESTIISLIYIAVQGIILDWICSPLNFPAFDLEEMLTNLPHTIHSLFSHNPVNALTFLVLGGIIFYATSFFMEIALARLADTGSVISAFNVVGIKEDIDAIGKWNYAKEFTIIVLAIALFTALKYIVIPVPILNYIWDVLLAFLIFVTQFWCIGAIYSVVKEKKSDSFEESG